jgi:hypothetical protein
MYYRLEKLEAWADPASPQNNQIILKQNGNLQILWEKNNYNEVGVFEVLINVS